MIVWVLMLLAAANAPSTHTVEIRGMEFHPTVLTVAVGDTIVWINRDIVPHTATARGRVRWDTGSLPQGGSGRFVTTHAGTLRYTCTFHPTMHGKLIIK